MARWRLHVLTDMKAGTMLRSQAREEASAIQRLHEYTNGRR